MKKKVHLVIIFNHAYEKNIPKLNKLYQERFDHISFLVPFSRSRSPNIIPVSGSSYYFQGFIHQAYRQIIASDSDIYLFIGDDVLLNPAINSKNIEAWLGMRSKHFFIADFRDLSRVSNWQRQYEALAWDPKNVPGLEVSQLLPDIEVAKKKLRRFAFTSMKIPPENLSQLRKQPVKFEMDYPLVGANSDFFAVRKDVIDEFVHYCGIFSACHLFVELAIPTALALSSPKGATAKGKKSSFQKIARHSFGNLEDRYEYKLNELLDDFPKNEAFIHPIKFSRWELL